MAKCIRRKQSNFMMTKIMRNSICDPFNGWRIREEWRQTNSMSIIQNDPD